MSDIETDEESQEQYSEAADQTERQKAMGEWMDKFRSLLRGDRLRWQATHTPRGEWAGAEFAYTYLEPNGIKEFLPDENQRAEIASWEGAHEGPVTSLEEFERFNESVRRRFAVDLDQANTKLDQIADDDAPDLVDGMIPENEITIGYGLPENGKSVWFQKLSIHKAAGIPFDDEPMTAGRVLYVSLDPGASKKKVKRRLLSMCARLEIDPSLIRDNFDLTDSMLRLNDRASVAAFLERWRGEFALIVIDSLYMAVDGEVATPSVATAAMKGALEIAQVTKAAVVIVHHEGRGAKGHPYGSIFLDAGASSIIFFSRKDKGEIVTLSVEKLKNGTKREAEVRFRFEDVFLDAPKIAPQASALAIAAAKRPDMLALIPTEWTLTSEARKLIEHLLTGSDAKRETDWRRARESWEAAKLIGRRGKSIKRVVS